MPHLHKLYLEQNKIGKEGALNLASFLLSHPHSISKINIQGNSVGDEGIKALAPLISSKPQIQWFVDVEEGEVLYINLHRTKCGDDGARAICDEIIKLAERRKYEKEGIPTRIFLRLSWNYIREKGIDAICEVLDHPEINVFSLDLYDNALSENLCEKICRYTSTLSNSLLSLNLDGNKVNKNCVMYLKRNTTIIQLGFGKKMLYEEDVRELRREIKGWKGKNKMKLSRECGLQSDLLWRVRYCAIRDVVSHPSVYFPNSNEQKRNWKGDKIFK